jgi:glycosyltransferase involved in cell wall biosynthesis
VTTAAIRCLHLITDVEAAGAEFMLYRLLRKMDRARFAPTVVALDRYGPVGHDIAALGIPVHALDMRNPRRWPSGWCELQRLIARVKPDVLQTWLYHADFVGLLAGRRASVRKIVWNVRSAPSPDDPHAIHRLARTNAWLSRWVDRIVINSERGRQVHARLGYPTGKMVVVPNGFDLQHFRPRPERRAPLRERWGIPADALVVGMAARWRAVKGYANFLHAAAIAAPREPRIWFALAGSNGVDESNPALLDALDRAGIRGRTTLMGFRDDPRDLYDVCDVYTSASDSEGFPNVIAEAMACGLPCGVTDAGDSAAIVADTGEIVARGEPALLADSWARLLRLAPAARIDIGRRARARIEAHYDIANVATRMERLYESLCSDDAR